jgi:hypothetical protein
MFRRRFRRRFGQPAIHRDGRTIILDRLEDRQRDSGASEHFSPVHPAFSYESSATTRLTANQDRAASALFHLHFFQLRPSVPQVDARGPNQIKTLPQHADPRSTGRDRSDIRSDARCRTGRRGAARPGASRRRTAPPPARSPLESRGHQPASTRPGRSSDACETPRRSI